MPADIKDILGFMGDDHLQSNFHNFFTNDRIFGSPSPPISGPFKATFGKVENHFN